MGNPNGSGTDVRQGSLPPAEQGSSQQTTMMSSGLPPGSTLSYDGETVKAGIGTFCWDSATLGMCADASGIVHGKKRLVVRPRASVSFAYQGRELGSLDVAAYEAGQEAPRGRVRESVYEISYKGDWEGKNLKTRRLGKEAQIVADLPPGEYVLGIFARMPEGDVSYGFLLTVKER